MKRRARYLKRLGELLVFHRILDRANELSEASLEETVMEFQAAADLYVDGIPGPETYWALQMPFALYEPKLDFVRCEAETAPGIDGYDRVYLRADAAERYQALHEEVVSLGAVLTSSGGKRALTQGASASRSSKSMHYAGLAFDLAIASGFFRPASDPFVVTQGEATAWTVWARADGGEEMELEAQVWKGRSWTGGDTATKTVKGRFINLTELCMRHGFHPIGPRLNFTRSEKRNYLGAEWWHFQANELLEPGLSQFGVELLRIEGYTPEFIRVSNEGVWSNRKVLFQKNWF